MPELLYYRHAWPESFATCPPDDDLGKWLARNGLREEVIFHFGTGAHHRLGQVAAWLGCYTIGITASRAEMDAYEELVIAQPDIAACYQVWFGDIYLLQPALLPELDIATLFHLCEFTDPRRGEYGGCTDYEVATRLISRLRPGGCIMAYPGSMAWDKAAPIFERLVAEGRLEAPQFYRSLAIYLKGAVA